MLKGKTIAEWKQNYPLLEEITALQEALWINEQYNSTLNTALTRDDIDDAAARLQRFAPYIEKAFPETIEEKGIIESKLIEIPKMQAKLGGLPGKLMLKCDSHLPISGSIKARGGIYEVLKHAEQLALRHNKITVEDDYSKLTELKSFFSKFSIAVGSTGNLGLSIGIMSAKLGFQVYVHMSADAKKWKKDLLREKGVHVVEHSSDFSEAVAKGREQASHDSNMYFVDDESSTDLFLGYAVAALRLQEQLNKLNVIVDEEHPLFVYLPCGVGGGPGGVTFGLKQIFGSNVHCFFAEPTHAPSMLIGLMTGLHEEVAVQDFGIDLHTEADGLAVGRPSGFVGKALEHAISGVYTVEDDKLFSLLTELADEENIYLEPSALAGLAGPLKVLSSEYINQNGFQTSMNQAAHIVWGTGGNMVPEAEMKSYYNRGEKQ
ncbi:D-serine ammonia-lyase [Cytobacillus purgationiresistens]|uniref:Probable D-serine dehydratase n=1 Tax=Cytobacillus purgationiresistens TaxID=863449 RepID=A0ABU0AI05_9BACI|nr:D-serine ammonia-lyase [Cytobacillus purgationiresistens]MDQ0270529.1 D-serine dehydratase [Cytobacillus purgationiresistens]